MSKHRDEKGRVTAGNKLAADVPKMSVKRTLFRGACAKIADELAVDYWRDQLTYKAREAPGKEGVVVYMDYGKDAAKAAKEVSDRGHGKPKETVQVERSPAEMSTEELMGVASEIIERRKRELSEAPTETAH